MSGVCEDARARGDLPQSPLLPFRWDLMGFGLSHAWVTGMLAQAAQVAPVPSTPLSYQMAMYVLAVLAAAALVLATPRASNRLQATAPFVLVAVAALACVGLATWGSLAALPPLMLAGFAGAGACGAFFEIVWAVRFSALPGSAIPLYVLFVMALSSLLNIALSFLPSWGAGALSVLLLVASAVLWAARPDADCPGTPDPKPSAGPSTRSLASVVLGCLVFSLTYNLFVTLVYESLPAEVASAVRFWANLLAALVLLASFMLVRQVSVVGIFRFIMPITAVGFVLYLLAPQGLGEAALAVAGVGRKFFDILTLVLVLRVVREFDPPGCRWVGLLDLAKNAGYGLGLGLASAAATAANAQLVQAATILPVLILVLIACFVWLFPEHTLQNLLGVKAASGPLEPPAPTLDDGVCRLAREYGLTPREQEVLGLLARGRTEAVIMERLAVSKGTAHTHVTHVYQKLGVHGQQELIEMAEKATPAAAEPQSRSS